MDSRFEELLRLIGRWSIRGENHLNDGTRLICRATHVAPEAWLHAVYPPLSATEVELLEQECGFRFPEEFRTFLECANGISIFSSSIEIWGYRSNYVRTGNAVWKPFDIVSHNERHERPKGSPKEVLFWGSAERGASWYFFEFQNETCRVGKTPRERFAPAQYWSDFWDWLLEETYSLASRYNDDGLPK